MLRVTMMRKDALRVINLSTIGMVVHKQYLANVPMTPKQLMKLYHFTVKGIDMCYDLKKLILIMNRLSRKMN